MTNTQNHIIQKLNIEIDVPDLAIARRIYGNISDLIHTRVLPAVEAELNRLTAGDHYRMEEATIELSLPEARLETALAGGIAEEVKKQLGTFEEKKDNPNSNDPLHHPGNPAQQQTAAEKRAELLIAFLQTGQLGWHAGTQPWLEEQDLVEAISAAPGSELKKLLVQQEVARRRLVSQFSSGFILKLLDIVFAMPVSFYWERLKVFYTEPPTRETKKAWLERLLAIATSARPEQLAEQLEEWIKQITTGEAGKPALKAPGSNQPEQKAGAEKKKPFSFEEEEGLYVNNAGLILLHPFLQYFFKEFNLLNGDAFIGETAQQTAIHLLHYLATGQEQPFEYDLLLEKFLCSFPLEEPVERFIIFTDAMKAECTSLLKAVIHHWESLKSTSPEGLQQGFLQRSGKLILQPHQHRLIVESQTIDILLRQLPWNHSIIQLPWMQQLLHVDWQTGFPA